MAVNCVTDVSEDLAVFVFKVEVRRERKLSW
jgi:hypothetical protein